MFVKPYFVKAIWRGRKHVGYGVFEARGARDVLRHAYYRTRGQPLEAALYLANALRDDMNAGLV